MPSIRLQKYLADGGVCSRRQGEVLIQAGRVRVNGRVVVRLGTVIDPAADRVEVDGGPVEPVSEKLYIALNKPAGVVTSCRHRHGDPIALDLVDVPQRIYPVGRLDKDSTGLLLLTNDGPLHHRLSHPSFDHEKEYRVSVARPILDATLQRLGRGVSLDGRSTRPAQVRRLGARRFAIVLREGRNRQIRRMVGALGHQVIELQRVRIADIRLGRLKPGTWRHLRADERARLLRLADRAPGEPVPPGAAARRYAPPESRRRKHPRG